MPLIGLFIPCYIDQFYPQVGMATVELLARLGVEVDFPQGADLLRTADGQHRLHRRRRAAGPTIRRDLPPYDYVVAPSGSCVAMVRHHYEEYFPHGHPLAADYERVRGTTFELTEYLIDVLGVTRFEGHFPHRVGLHQSCHGLRELRLGSSSELVGPPFNKARSLARGTDGNIVFRAYRGRTNAAALAARSPSPRRR